MIYNNLLFLLLITTFSNYIIKKDIVYKLNNCCLTCPDICKYRMLSENLTIFYETEYIIICGNKDIYKPDGVKIGEYINTIFSFISYKNIKESIKKNKIVYMVGNSAREFEEFKVFEDIKSTEGFRNLIDIQAFSNNGIYPGYLKNLFSGCNSDYQHEDIIFHEIIHSIHLSGMTFKQREDIKKLYDKYKIPNSKYNINSYAFLNEMEFFAEMMQVYGKLTLRSDVTAGISYTYLKNKMKDFILFVNSSIYTEDDLKKLKKQLCYIKQCDYCKY